jgi:WD40 repeat protein
VAGYDAFISYSHAADGTFAPSLQDGLQRLGRRWNQRRALHVFRDQTGLAVTPHLWGSITAALDTARWFVLLASPESAQSDWVGKEIEYWLAKPGGGTDRMLLVVTGGTCVWQGSRFTDDSTAVHEKLRHAFTEEPLYQDLSWARTADHLDLHNPRFRDDVARIAAPIHGVDQDELVGEDIRQYKLARRLRRAAFAGLATLTAAALVATLIALHQKDQADTNAAQARSRELAATARSTMDDDPTLAALLAVDANYPNGATTPIGLHDAEVTLGMALRNRLWTGSIRVGAPIDAPRASIVDTRRERLATVDPADCCDRMQWWDTATGRRVRSPITRARERAILERYGSSHVAGSSAFARPPSIGPRALTDPFTVAADGTTLVAWDRTAHAFAVTPDGDRVVRNLALPATVDPAFVVVLTSGRVVALTTDGRLFTWAGDGPASPVSYTPPAGTTVRTIAALGADSLLVDSAVPAPGSPPRVPTCSVACPDDSEVVTDTFPIVYLGSSVTDPHLEVVDLTRPASPVRRVSGAAVTVPGSYAVAPVGRGPHRFVAARTIQVDGAGDANVQVWDVGAGSQPRLVATIPSLSPTDLRWLDGATLAMASARGVTQYRINVPAIRTTPSAGLAVSRHARAILPATTTGTGSPIVLGRSAPRTPPSTLVSASAVPGTLSLSADGRLAATVRARTGDHQCASLGALCVPGTSVIVTRVDTGRAVTFRRSGRDPAARAGAVSFDPSGRLIAFGTASRAAMPGRSTDASGAIRGDVTVVRVRDRRVVQRVAISDFVPSVIAWTADGAQLVVSGQDEMTRWRVRLLDRSSGALRWLTARDDCADQYCPAVSTSPDDRWIATTAANGVVRLWPKRDGHVATRPVTSFVSGPGTPTGVAFAADGRTLVTSGRALTAVWDLSRVTAPRRLDVLSALPALASIPQPGSEAATDSGTGVPAPSTPWGLVAFAPDGRSLTIAGPAGVVTLPDVDPGLGCSLASPADLRAAGRVLGAPSACTRVPALRRRLAVTGRAPRPEG